jgi:hypothetical protein
MFVEDGWGLGLLSVVVHQEGPEEFGDARRVHEVSILAPLGLAGARMRVIGSFPAARRHG